MCFSGYCWCTDHLSTGLLGETLLQKEQLPAYSDEHFLTWCRWIWLETVVSNSLNCRKMKTDISAGAWSDDGSDGSFVFRRWTQMQRTTWWGISTSDNLSPSQLRRIPFCPSCLPSWNSSFRHLNLPRYSKQLWQSGVSGTSRKHGKLQNSRTKIYFSNQHF